MTIPRAPGATPARLPGLVALVLLSVLAPARALAEVQTAERIVAVVNSEIILLSELHERAQQMNLSLDEAKPEARRQVEQQLRQLVERMVDDLLVMQQAGELKLGIETIEIDRAVDEIKKSNNLEGGAFERALAEQGFSIASYRRDMRKQLLRMKVLNTAVRSRIQISDEEVKQFYEQSVRQSGQAREARVRHVLIAVPAKADPREVEKKRGLAARILEELRGGADFAQVARRSSDDAATRETGGELGWVKEGEGLNAALREVIFSMEQPDELRGPVRTDRGFEVLQLIERKDGDVRPLGEIKDQIRQQIYQQQMEKQTQLWLGELRRKAHIDVRY